MTVSVRLTRGETRIRRIRRQGGVEHAPLRAIPVVAEEPAPRKRHGGPSEDRALYNCQCGFVFQAHVSTSVGCPHCGGTQAW
jgi:hypothetical protein